MRNNNPCKNCVATGFIRNEHVPVDAAVVVVAAVLAVDAAVDVVAVLTVLTVVVV